MTKLALTYNQNKPIAILSLLLFLLFFSCKNLSNPQKINPKFKEVTAKEILGNPNYQAICYGGYRQTTRDIEPTIEEIKEDLKILDSLNIKVIRTYNVHLSEAENIMKAIRSLQQENSKFEMYVMLGAWIDCKNAWTNLEPNHNEESERNAKEIDRAVALAKQYPDIIKIIAVGNEAMVHWASSYFVQPSVILKWVNHLQNLKKENKLDKNLWITSSDDFASWGGGDPVYRTKDLEAIIHAVDYVSMHTYPYHNSHYNPDYWKVPAHEEHLSPIEKVNAAMIRAREFAQNQYKEVKNYVHSINSSKPIHIGETGWASSSDGFYGNEGSKASDEYKEALFYNAMREWTNKEGISCFYFEAFNENWKDNKNPKGSENHFGLFTIDGKAKYALWKEVEKGTFKNLKRNGKSITKTYNGDEVELMKTVHVPPSR